VVNLQKQSFDFEKDINRTNLLSSTLTKPLDANTKDDLVIYNPISGVQYYFNPVKNSDSDGTSQKKVDLRQSYTSQVLSKHSTLTIFWADLAIRVQFSWMSVIAQKWPFVY
jgi:hypothetical protein